MYLLGFWASLKHCGSPNIIAHTFTYLYIAAKFSTEERAQGHYAQFHPVLCIPVTLSNADADADADTNAVASTYAILISTSTSSAHSPSAACTVHKQPRALAGRV
jgi:hypothetical protein